MTVLDRIRLTGLLSFFEKADASEHRIPYNVERMRNISPRTRVSVGFVALAGLLLAGCGPSLTSYVKPEAPWAAIKRVAVSPFNLPSENPVDRKLITDLFSEELRRTGKVEVVEVPLNSPAGSGVADIQQVARQYKVDALFSGSLDDSRGTAIHVRCEDVATQELLWSGTYLLGSRGEFFSLQTQPQKVQRAFKHLLNRFVKQLS